MRFPKRVSFGFLAGVLLLGLLVWPATTRQGVNFKVTKKRIPIVVKGMDFLVRDYEYRHLAAEITQGLSAEEAKTEALFRWTREQIRPVPPGWPVVDDHIAHIIIRGYGTDDQMADLFTTLATYAGIPSFWRMIRSRDNPEEDRMLSFAKIGNRWTVWDVTRGTALRDATGRLIDVQQLGLERFGPTRILRAQRQMPGLRLLDELRAAGRRLLGRPLESDE